MSTYLTNSDGEFVTLRDFHFRLSNDIKMKICDGNECDGSPCNGRVLNDVELFFATEDNTADAEGRAPSQHGQVASRSRDADFEMVSMVKCQNRSVEYACRNVDEILTSDRGIDDKDRNVLNVRVTHSRNPNVDGGWGWVIVACALVFTSVIGGCYTMFSIMYIDYVSAFDTNKAIAGWIGSIYMASGNFFGLYSEGIYYDFHLNLFKYFTISLKRSIVCYTYKPGL